MARYTGPKVKIARRLGANIFENEKGARALDRRHESLVVELYSR